MTHPTPSRLGDPDPPVIAPHPTETPTCLCTSGAVICLLFAGCQRNRLDFPSQIFIFGNKRKDLVNALTHCNYFENRLKYLNNLENPKALPRDFHIVSAIVSFGLRARDQNAA